MTFEKIKKNIRTIIVVGSVSAIMVRNHLSTILDLYVQELKKLLIPRFRCENSRTVCSSFIAFKERQNNLLVFTVKAFETSVVMTNKKQCDEKGLGNFEQSNNSTITVVKHLADDKKLLVFLHFISG